MMQTCFVIVFFFLFGLELKGETAGDSQSVLCVWGCTIFNIQGRYLYHPIAVALKRGDVLEISKTFT